MNPFLCMFVGKAATPVPAGEEGSATCILGAQNGNPSRAEQRVNDLAVIVSV
jgi:hypothetical protein